MTSALDDQGITHAFEYSDKFVDVLRYSRCGIHFCTYTGRFGLPQFTIVDRAANCLLCMVRSWRTGRRS